MTLQAPPVTVNTQVNAPVTGEIRATFGNITANFPGLGALVGQIGSEVAGKLFGSLRSGTVTGSAGFDGQMHPAVPDGSVMHGAH
jgi:hypothetical protein